MASHINSPMAGIMLPELVCNHTDDAVCDVWVSKVSCHGASQMLLDDVSIEWATKAQT